MSELSVVFRKCYFGGWLIAVDICCCMYFKLSAFSKSGYGGPKHTSTLFNRMARRTEYSRKQVVNVKYTLQPNSVGKYTRFVHKLYDLQRPFAVSTHVVNRLILSHDRQQGQICHNTIQHQQEDQKHSQRRLIVERVGSQHQRKA